jgi:hypothetical protein
MAYVRDVLLSDPDARFTVVITDDIRDVDAKTDGWVRRYLGLAAGYADRVEVLRLPAGSRGDTRLTGYYIGQPLLGFLNQVGAKQRFWDVIVSSAFPSNPAIKAFGNRFWKRAVGIELPLVGWSVWTATENREWAEKGANRWDCMAELMGSLVCDLLVFESEKVRQDHVDNYRKYFKPSVIEMLLQDSMVATNGVDIGAIARHRYDGSRLPRVLWSSRYQEDGAVVIPALLDAYRMGKVESVTLNLMDGEIPERLREDIAQCGDAVRVVGPMPNDQYKRFIGEFDVFASFVYRATYGIRFAEMASAGCLPVCHDLVASILFPKNYPYHTADAARFPAVFMAALDDYRKNPAIIEPVFAELDAKHDTRRNMLGMHERIRQVVTARRAEQTFGSFGPLVAQALAGVDEIGHDEACARIAVLTKSGEPLEKNPFFPPIAIRWAILAQGYRDVGGQAVPVYRKVKV